MKGVFQFIDYRKFLEHYYQEQKRRKRFFSYRWFARKAGLSSHSFLKSVIEGKRNLTTRAVERFCAGLELNAREARYFTALVRFNQAKTAREKQESFASLRSFRGAVREEVLNSGQYDYYAKWYAPILRELICLRDFGDDYEALGKAVIPPISASEARKGVELLAKLDLVARAADGSWRQTRTSIKADGALTSLAVRSYMATVLDHAKQALVELDKSERHLSSLTLGVSPAAYEALVTEIREFKERVKDIVSRDEEPSRVYHFNLGLFPASRKQGPDDGQVGAPGNGP